MSLNLKHIRWLKAIDLVLALFDVKYGRTPLRNLIAATQRLSDVVIQYLLADDSLNDRFWPVRANSENATYHLAITVRGISKFSVCDCRHFFSVHA